MAEWIDELARSVARGQTRRATLRIIGGGVAAAVLNLWLPRPAAASGGKTRHASKGNDGQLSSGPAGNNQGNDECAHFCQAVFPPGADRGKCVSDAAHNGGLCFQCNKDLSRLCRPASGPPTCCQNGDECCGDGVCRHSCNSGTGGCTPTTCAAQSKNCGTISDGCGVTLNCGDCTGTGQTCGGGGTPNVCGCTDNGQACLNKTCGTIANNCGQSVTCQPNNCRPPQTCGGGGPANVCGCTDNGLACQGKNCGSVNNNCNLPVSCGACTSPDTCGGGGTPNVC